MAEEVEKRGAAVSVYCSDLFPSHQSLSVHCGAERTDAWIETANEAIDFDQLGSIFVHRFAPGAPNPELDPTLVALSVATSRSALSNAIEALPIRCVNPIWSASLAQSRLLQAQTARCVGLPVPESVVTNSLKTAREFVAHYGAGVVRWLIPALPSAEPGPGVHRAQCLTEEHLQADSVDFRFVPRLIQRYVPKRRDIRCVFVDGQVFAVSLEDSDARGVDWRRGATRPWQACSLNTAQNDGIQSLMKSLELTFATLDFADDFFLDLNPYGEWFWMERSLGLPIASALADCLLR